MAFQKFILFFKELKLGIVFSDLFIATIENSQKHITTYLNTNKSFKWEPYIFLEMIRDCDLAALDL